jgi:hypothetical protein
MAEELTHGLVLRFESVLQHVVVQQCCVTVQVQQWWLTEEAGW